MKFTVTWTEERSATIDVANISMAEAWGKSYMKRAGSNARLLSIYAGTLTPQPTPAPPPLISYARHTA